jgi:hypothetical protein
MEKTDFMTLQEQELVKPEKPPQLDEAQLRQNIETEYLLTFKQPGHPILSFEILHESNITPTEQCSGYVKSLTFVKNLIFLLIIL